jgi:lipopolysaccharide/colanic/teichoic acid biosynthesis glycosyltransferase
MDIVFSLVGILMLFPLVLIVSFVIMLTMGRPILFKQIRPGLHAKPFVLYKFRTMLDQKDKNGNFLLDEKRLTGFGKFLRKTSLDELPELWNVLKGDMSLVGPRPLLMEYLDRYTPEQTRRHEMKPGITGWAQVNGRNAISWEEKFKLDVWYVDNWNILLDIKIIFLTILKVLKGEGISAEGHATMPEFKGTTKG